MGPNFPHLFRLALGPPSLLYNGYRVFPGVKERPGCDADPSPLLVPWSRKGRAIPLLPLWALRSVQSLSAYTGCTLLFFNMDSGCSKSIQHFNTQPRIPFFCYVTLHQWVRWISSFRTMFSAGGTRATGDT